nr:BamA/TamA family outer membrane protein [uncultured Capnocytophaga sp.]
MKHIFVAKTLFLLLAVAWLQGCNPTKKVPEGAYLLRKNTISVNDKKPKNSYIYGYLRQEPNSRLLGIPLGLLIYNLADDHAEENYQKWLERHPKWHRFLDGFLSKKQTQRLGKSFLISGKDRMLQHMGQAPVIIDTVQTRKTAQTLHTYYNSVGYFNNKSHYEIISSDKKKQASVTYVLDRGQRYYIDSLDTQILSAEVDSLYKKHIKERIIKPHTVYRLENFANERARITNLLRNNGFYNFQQSAIDFTIARDTVFYNRDSLINVTTTIANYLDRSTDPVVERPYKAHQIKKVHLYTDYEASLPVSAYDSIVYKGITYYYRHKLRYRRQTLYDAIALRSKELYRDTDRNNAYRQINNLRAFKYPNIQYHYAKNDTLQHILEADIFLEPLKRFSTETTLELSHSTIQDFGIGFSTSFIARNVFRGAETLEVTPRITMGAQQFLDGSSAFFNIFEYGGSLRLTIPRIWFFGRIESLIPFSKTPQTILQFSTGAQENIGLDRQKTTGVIRYTWNPNITNRNILELLDIEYVHNKNPRNYFNVYESSYEFLNQIVRNEGAPAGFLDAHGNLYKSKAYDFFLYDMFRRNWSDPAQRNINLLNLYERFYHLTRNDLILATSFTYMSNNTMNYYEPNYEQFRVKVETAGNLPQLFNIIRKLPTDDQGQRKFMDVAYAQYAKAEVEYIKHFPLSVRKNSGEVLALRGFVGFAKPYGNGKYVPFSRSYFAGGANDNRGWRAYSLGPGSSGSVLEFNEANFKLAANVEYRFTIANALKGALFLDAGNIWHLLDEENRTEAMLDRFSDISDIALATGFGLRFDMNYFVIRGDFGMKLYNPSIAATSHWTNELKLSDFVFNIGINYPF